jgi:ribosome-associated toxin RatA of RatAB toxin-antitoxin module
MPNVDVDVVIRAPADVVWSTINDLASYPKFMANVQSVEVTSEDGADRVSKWSVLLKGSLLEWTEREHVDVERLRITFDQVDGDLNVFQGFWAVEAVSPETTSVVLSVEFEIGIPLLADMLNPVAGRALRENSEHMLREIEQRVLAS